MALAAARGVATRGLVRVADTSYNRCRRRPELDRQTVTCELYVLDKELNLGISMSSGSLRVPLVRSTRSDSRYHSRNLIHFEGTIHIRS